MNSSINGYALIGNKSSYDLGIARTYQQSNFGTGVNVANTTNVNLGSLSLAAGKWMLQGRITYPSSGNQTGYRRCGFYFTIGSTEYNWYTEDRPSPSGYQCIIVHQRIANLSTATTVYLRAYHNAGVTINGVTGYILALRLS